MNYKLVSGWMLKVFLFPAFADCGFRAAAVYLHRCRCVVVVADVRVYRAPPPFPARGRVPRSRRRPYRPGRAFDSVSATRTGVATVARRRSASSDATSRRATVACRGDVMPLPHSDVRRKIMRD